MNQRSNIKKFNEQYFIDNGYWIEMENEKGSYSIYESTEKWRMLIDTCIRNNGLYNLITMNVLIKTIEDGELKRTKPLKRKLHIKKVRPEGYMTVVERKLHRSKIQKIRRDRKKLNNVNRKSK